MTVQPVSDPKMPIGEILNAAGFEGLLLKAENKSVLLCSHSMMI